MSKKRTDYIALQKALGLVRGLSDDFVKACIAEDVPIEAIDRLVTVEGYKTLEVMARQIKTDWQASQFPVQWFDELVEVNYGVRPSFEELNGQWFRWASDSFLTKQPVLRPIRANAPATSIEEVRMGYIQLDHDYLD